MIGNESSGPYQNKFSIFNINTNTWQKQADVNFNYAASRFAHTAVVLKDRYLAVYSREGFIRLYDIVKKEWSSKNNIELDYASDQSNFNLFTDSSDSRILYLAYTKYGEFRIFQACAAKSQKNLSVKLFYSLCISVAKYFFWTTEVNKENKRLTENFDRLRSRKMYFNKK